MFERFTDQARQAVVLGQDEATRLNHHHIGTEHLLAGLLREERGAAARALEASGVSLDAVRERTEALTGPGQGPPRGHIPFTPRAKKSFELALREAARLGRDIGTGHLLLGLLGQADCAAVQVLGSLGMDLAAFRARVITETESRPEGLELSVTLRSRARLRRTVPPDPALVLLDAIEERLSAIERHLGMDSRGPSGGPENVVPPS
jgi:ATP-dependent Clp protease ATP-binding subunit ClpC